MNIIKIDYDKLSSNKEKFNYLEQLFSENVQLSDGDFKKLLSDDVEVTNYFIDEYHFQDIQAENSKYKLIVSYLKDRINDCDQYQLSDIIGLVEKIDSWEVLKSIDLNNLDNLKITIILNSIENIIGKSSKTDCIIRFLDKLNKFKLDNLNQFILLFIKSNYDKSFIDPLKEYYNRHSNNSDIEKRIDANPKKYLMILPN
jgi:hypothetical protein